jgi:hypothetical protein
LQSRGRTSKEHAKHADASYSREENTPSARAPVASRAERMRDLCRITKAAPTLYVHALFTLVQRCTAALSPRSEA